MTILNVSSHQGYCRYTIETDAQTKEKSVYVEKRESFQHGFGTASTRLLMKVSFDNGCEGRLRNDASWSSHIFHLRMGMVPVEREISVIQHYFGTLAGISLDQFKNVLKVEDLSDVENSTVLKTMLIYARTEKCDAAEARKLSDQELFEGKEEILALENKSCSYIQNQFVPGLLSVLKHQSHKPVREMSTSSWGSVTMQMSEEGKKRWKEDLNGNAPFVPFRDFAQLHSYMTLEQIEELKKVLTA